MNPAPQRYSSTLMVTNPAGTCLSLPSGMFMYESASQGGTYGGSSGSAAVKDGGYVVGQLYGKCGPNATAGCDPANKAVDGALAQTYPSVANYLFPTQTGTCTPNATTACLLNKRFKATVKYRNAFDNNPANADAQVKSVTGFSNPNFETVFFYFNSPDNIEMLLKMLDQGNVNGSGQPTIAVLFGSATPLRIEVTITDMQTGAVKQYTSAFGGQAGSTDFTAFVK